MYRLNKFLIRIGSQSHCAHNIGQVPVEVPASVATPVPGAQSDAAPTPTEANLQVQLIRSHEGTPPDNDESASESDYLSFGEDESDSEVEHGPETKDERAARENERQMVLEAAGLIIKQDVKPPPRPARRKKRRPPPAAPARLSISSTKDLPGVPADEEPPPADHATHLDDAFDRYESFKQSQRNANRLSYASSVDTSSSPTISSVSAASIASPTTATGEGRTHSSFLSFLGRKTPVENERRTLSISGPIAIQNDETTRSSSPAFGSNWASLVDKEALEGLPTNERRRQEAIFELIATETAYVHDLQLIVEVFYASMLPLLDTKAVTVVFANIEDILLTNTTFVSSLEERQKDCRLYIDRIGDILQSYMVNMSVYTEYCVNQSNATKVLQSLRDTNPELATHLQSLRDDPATRHLDLSSFLLIPMQRITRYPLLIRQVLHYTEPGEEHTAIQKSLSVAEKILDNINETIRDQEGQETLKKVSQHLWIGQGRLDLTAPTRYMGPRRLLKEGTLMKAKSGRKLHALLCSDILVLADATVKNLYRMPIALSEAKVRDIPGGRDDLGFQITLPYPRGGESINLRASSVRDCQLWMEAVEKAVRKCKEAEQRARRSRG
ncbi:hypothetical protein PM082_020315 [Marasmius tenuissimus]|nr:hypothetical protein PM082_020315 [Marasmius tenuissimus]